MKTVVEDNLGGDKCEIAGISTSFGTTFPPIDKPNSIWGILRHSKSVNEGSSENGLFETIGASFTIKVRKNEANSGEVVPIGAERIEKLPELGAFLRR